MLLLYCKYHEPWWAELREKKICIFGIKYQLSCPCTRIWPNIEGVESGVDAVDAVEADESFIIVFKTEKLKFLLSKIFKS